MVFESTLEIKKNFYIEIPSPQSIKGEVSRLHSHATFLSLNSSCEVKLQKRQFDNLNNSDIF